MKNNCVFCVIRNYLTTLLNREVEMLKAIYTNWHRRFYLAQLFCVLFCFLLTSCTVNTSGYSEELTSKAWEAKLDGGAEVVLKFEDDYASLIIENGNLKNEIKGKCIVDDTSFVIFDTQVDTNYLFNYEPQGNSLLLKRNDNTIVLKARDSKNK